MSEFTCKYGHIMSSCDKYCLACAEEGRPFEHCYYMDGMTSTQLMKQEADENRRAYGDDEDDGYPD